jgi:acyl carrier protein
MNTNTMEEEIITLIKQINPFDEIQESTELVRTGILTSVALFELVYLLEDKFNIDISEEFFIPDNFVSVSAIKELVSKLTVR